MSSIVVCAHLQANDETAKAQLLESLTSCCDYAVNEPGVTRYVICTPNADEPLNLMVVEEYTDQAAYDSHMASPPVADLLSKAGNLLSGETKIYTLSWLPGFLERQSRLPSPDGTFSEGQVKGPFVIWAAISDSDQATVDVLAPLGRAVVEDSAEHEPDTIFYADAVPREGSQNNDVSGGLVCAVEMYATREAGLQHMGRSSVRELVTAGKTQGSNFHIKFFNVIHGFMTKG